MKKINYIFIILLLYSLTNQSQNKKVIDSLNNYVAKAINDTDKVNRINKFYADELWKYHTAYPYKLLKEALALSISSGYTKGEMKTYGHLTGYCLNQGNLEFATKYCRQAMAIAIELKDSTTYAGGLSSLGRGYRDAKQYDSAMVYLLRSFEISKRLSVNDDRKARIYSQLGFAYHFVNNDSLAIYYLTQSLMLRQKINYLDGIDASLSMLIRVYLDQNNYPKVLETSLKTYENRVLAKDSLKLIELGLQIGHAYAKLGKLDSAKFYLQKYQDEVYKFSDIRKKDFSYSMISGIYEILGDNTKALFYLKLFTQYYDSTVNVESAQTIANLQTLYDVEEKENRINVLDKDKKIREQNIKMQRIWLLISSIIIISIAFLVYFIYKAYRNKNSINEILEDKNKVIEEKNKDITDSINYAKRLQNALMPSLSDIKKAFPESFIFYSPKDIVSGDFYWYCETKNDYYLALADCTGHGVPGAFMSSIGINFLNQIVKESQINSTHEILNELHKRIIFALNKSSENRDIKDGMDMSLLRINKAAKKIYFSGAGRSILHYSSQLHVLKGDMYSIGGIKSITDETYTEKEIQISDSSDLIYLYSDGFVDQFGGPKGKKFKNKQLEEVIIKIHSLSMDEQKKEIANIFNQWKGNLDQVDDVTLIGIKINLWN